ncbi:MAG: ThiF family adenylyltransferase [Deltaproteobacteria bacterium]|nr:ThiF family adenylyltransferase [Deltaproteobacteria bacterium]
MDCKALELNEAMTVRKFESHYIIVFENSVKKLTFQSKVMQQEFERIVAQGSIESDSISEGLLKVLCDYRIVVPMVDLKYKNTTFDRTAKFIRSAYGQLPDESVWSKRILILGAGGVGQIVLQHLAAAGFKEFTIIDCDTVCPTNLNRQLLLSYREVGQRKVTAVKDRVQSLLPVNIVAHDIEIKSVSDLDGIVAATPVNLIVCAADYPINMINRIVATVALKRSVPCCFASVGLQIASVGPMLVSEDSKQRYLSWKRDENDGQTIYQSRLAASISFTNTMTSVLLGFEIFKFLTGLGSCEILDRELFVCGESGKNIYCRKV